MSGNGFFIPHHIDAIRMGVPVVIGHPTIAVYDVIRAHVWYRSAAPRDVRSKFGRVHALRERTGAVAAPLSLGEIADMMGWKSKTSVKPHLRALKKHGWLRVEVLDERAKEYAYIVGEETTDSMTHTKSHLVFYADGWFSRCRRSFLRSLAERFESEEVNVMSVPFEERVKFVREWSEKDAVRRRKHLTPVEPEEDDDEEEVVGEHG